MYNKVILIGRLTKDVDSRVTNSGTPVATFTLAVNRPFNKEETDFINCVVWKKLAEIVAQYTRKGSLISVEGRMQNRSYDAQDGSKRYVTEVVCDNVVFLDTKSDQNEKPKKDTVNKADKYYSTPNLDINEDSLPF